ncbi:RNA polymerase sigma-70 factor [Sandaracinus amylolyticus]|uniref:Sigma-70 region 2 domain protein n=1 Tax=Sandaracinus amylolyticus TaxID=927083 RepID=A0A0F6SHH0_9BACT|nr:RNA polymerase sigma-70 factor [Sandaracinus amylolyticus]AKF10429.1 sigma-70 region 2 domain protein [Sandaracinus amylolyticus]
MSDDPFVAHRGLLFTVAYEMLGSVADADDVVQETWLRWASAARPEVRDPRAYLVRIVTRQALNRLRSRKRRREDYVGEWLPEPLLVGPEVAEDVELAESISMAMLTGLETLGPTERAVFVLREVFETPYDEIAAAVGKTPAAVRQIAHRAREHVAARRPRMQVTRAEQEAVIARFLEALTDGDVRGLVEVLAPDVALVPDGGGVVPALRVSLVGVESVVRALSGFAKRARAGTVVSRMWINGGPAARIDVDGVLDTAISFVVEDGRITRIYAVRNPHKLTPLREAKQVTLQRSTSRDDA